jgi:hypothetical protein
VLPFITEFSGLFVVFSVYFCSKWFEKDIYEAMLNDCVDFDAMKTKWYRISKYAK